MMNSDSASATQSRGQSILVADDDSDVLALQASILENEGFVVVLAKDGEAAWRALLAKEYDLLVTDYVMPKLSGLALIRQLRLARITLPVVMVSGTIDTLDTDRLARDPWSRIHAFVRKPFTVSELLAAVHSALQIPKPA